MTIEQHVFTEVCKLIPAASFESPRSIYINRNKWSGTYRIGGTWCIDTSKGTWAGSMISEEGSGQASFRLGGALGHYIEPADIAFMIGAHVIAFEFGDILGQWLTPTEQRAVVARNHQVEGDSAICHSHDFCDSSDALDRAFLRVTGLHIDLQNDNDVSLWNEARSIAKAGEFYFALPVAEGKQDALAAAAPDLLAALLDVVSHLELDFAHDAEGRERRLKLARAAIAKARGIK